MTIKTTTTRVEQFPWIQTVVMSYAKRIRVNNFDALGKKCFTNVMADAILGHNSYFIWQDERPISYLNIKNDDIQDTVSKVSTIDLEGHCYDADGNELMPDRLRCLKLTNPPVTSHALNLASRAYNFDLMIGNNLQDLVIPQPVVTGTSPDVDIRTSDTNMEEHRQWAKFDANDDHSTIITPQVKWLGQWDTEKLKTMQQLTLLEFMMETGLPPQDAPVLDTLGASTQSLISNREAFVSNTYIIKQDVSAVFEGLGVKMNYQILFPQTAQDIASIGDAYGKGANQEVLNNYALV